MDVLSLRELKESYAVAKLDVKKWEEDYKLTYGSRPNKEALHQAPTEIKEAYKTYWRSSKQLSILKRGKNLPLTSVSSSQDELSPTLNKLTSSEDHSTKPDNSLSEHNVSIPNPDPVESNSNPSRLTSVPNRLQSELNEVLLDSNEIHSEPNGFHPKPGNVDHKNGPAEFPKAKVGNLSTVWGHHLNKRKSLSSQNVGVELSLYSKMAENMKSHAVIKTRTSLKRIPSKVLPESESKSDPSLMNPETDKGNSDEISNLKDISNYQKDSDDLEMFKDGKLNLSGNVVCSGNKSGKKVNHLSVNHLSVDSTSTKEKLLARQWNKSWIKRCNASNDLPVASEKSFDSREKTNLQEGLTHGSDSIITESHSFPLNDSPTFDFNASPPASPPKILKRKFNSPVSEVDNSKRLKLGEDSESNFAALNDGKESVCAASPTKSFSRATNSVQIKKSALKSLSDDRQPDIKQKQNKDHRPDQVLQRDRYQQQDKDQQQDQHQQRDPDQRQDQHQQRDPDQRQDQVLQRDRDQQRDEDQQQDEDYHPESETEPDPPVTKGRSRVTRKRKARSAASKDAPPTLARNAPRAKRVAKKAKPKADPQKGNDAQEEQSSKMEVYDDLMEMQAAKPHVGTAATKHYSKEERFHKKIASGKANENFVKINLKKKVFVRGKKRMTSENYKRQEWKKKQVMQSAEGGNEKAIKKMTCFKCGDFGHWAFKCPGKIGDVLLPIDRYNENESTFLTLEEASNMANGISASSTATITKMYNKEADDQNECSAEDSENEVFSDWDEDIVEAIEISEKACSDQTQSSLTKEPLEEKGKDSPSLSVQPLYQLSNDQNLMATPPEVFQALKLFGHNSFRSGQEEVIMRVLSGQSTLLVQSTGSGKSLCYQLPAYLYSQGRQCITLCVSPLVSLMEDQVTGLPPFIKAVCFHTQQSPANREKAMTALKSGNVHIILVSPEAVVSSSGGGVLGALLKDLPPIAFACLDEAHCLSEWSHNFRPSYLQVCKILRERLHVNTFLGLTATARNETAKSIARHLQIPSLSKGVIMGTCIPSNLMLSASRDTNREEALIHLLTGKRFGECSSVIIYCTRRAECERIATFIRTQMVTPSQIDVKSNAKRQRGISLDAEAYHAGLSGFRRQQIQKRFMSGKLRIVVATVAFGMGIDKADVQGIVHFNMPRNLESYVQEIGRAGRDGNIAHCHLFLDSSDGKDIQELKRHIFINSVDRFIVRKLLNKVFVSNICVKANKLIDSSSQEVDSENQKMNPEDTNSLESTRPEKSSPCLGHEVAIPIEELVEALDLPEENIQTLLCYLETHPSAKLKLSHHVYSMCNVACYRGPKQLCAVSRKCPPLAVAIALQRKQGKALDKANSIAFPVVSIASQMGWESRIVKRELKHLEWDTSGLQGGGGVRQSGVKVDFSDLSFHLTVRCDLGEEMQDQILEDIYERACKQEKDQLRQLQYTYQVLRKASNASILLCSDEIDEEKSLTLKETIGDYFDRCNEEGLSSVQLEEQLYLRPEAEQRIQSDVRSLLSVHSDLPWTGRAVARVLHGIASPNFPAKVWGRVRRFWRLHLETDFNLLVAIATKELLKFK